MWSPAWLAFALRGRNRMARELAGVVAPHPERVGPEPALEVRRRLLRLRVRRDQRGVHGEQDGVAQISAGRRRGGTPSGSSAQTRRRVLARARLIRTSAAPG